jgi:hypothetical protein
MFFFSHDITTESSQQRTEIVTLLDENSTFSGIFETETSTTILESTMSTSPEIETTLSTSETVSTNPEWKFKATDFPANHGTLKCR